MFVSALGDYEVQAAPVFQELHRNNSFDYPPPPLHPLPPLPPSLDNSAFTVISNSWRNRVTQTLAVMVGVELVDR